MKKRSVTLMEMIIAIVLLSVIVLAAASFDFAAGYFVQSSRRKGALINEISFITEHMAKNVSLVTGDSNDPGIIVIGNTIVKIRQDINKTTLLPNNTIDYTDDRWVMYKITGKKLQFCPDANKTGNNCNVSFQILTDRIYTGGATPPPKFSHPALNQVKISGMDLIYDAAETFDVRTNPRVYLPAGLVFSSPCHSIN